ncbi:MAG TPA: hypothetical protein VFE33_26605 [Thermoanaerobaculia bacterium]|nr:hypothetical protein [Thermoanaerobaculia bacterium]
MRKALRCLGVGVLVLSFVLAILAPAFADVQTKAGCGMSCCRPGQSVAHAMPAMPGTQTSSCGRCNLRSGSSGSFAVLPAGLPPSVLPTPTALPKPSGSQALLAVPGGLLDSLTRDLPDQPPRG